MAILAECGRVGQDPMGGQRGCAELNPVGLVSWVLSYFTAVPGQSGMVTATVTSTHISPQEGSIVGINEENMESVDVDA